MSKETLKILKGLALRLQAAAFAWNAISPEEEEYRSELLEAFYVTTVDIEKLEKEETPIINNKVVTDEYIDSLYKGHNFGSTINNSTKAKRAHLAKVLRNQLAGYWSGHTAYSIAVDGGFLFEDKRQQEKKLTRLGIAFLEEEGGSA